MYLYVTVPPCEGNRNREMTYRVEASLNFSDVTLVEAFNFKMKMITSYSETYGVPVTAEWDFERKGRLLSESGIKTALEAHDSKKK